MHSRSPLGCLSIIALLVALMAGVTWYYNQLYHNTSLGSVRSENQIKINPNMGSDASGERPNIALSGDISKVVEDLKLPKEQLEQAMVLVRNLLNEEEQANREINALISKVTEDTAITEQIGVLQRDFRNKFDLFQLDLSDLIGDQSAGALTKAMEAVIPPILLQNSAPVPAMDMDMQM